MKQKILTLIIGILIGAVVTAGCFLIFAKPGQGHKKNENRPEMGNFVPGESTNGSDHKGPQKDQNTEINDTQSSETTDSSNTTNANS